MPQGSSHSLINLGDLSKPANTLIEKISNAIGGIYKPYQIRRIAEAKAEANKIRAVSEIEVSELKYRALERFLIEQAKQQANIESITNKALPLVNETAAPENIADDWVTNFFQRCRFISDVDMQALWARILSGEANSPGSFAKKTINLLSDLDQGDASSFTRLCGFAVVVDCPTVLVYGIHNPYLQHGVTDEVVTHLDTLGLVNFSSFEVQYRADLPHVLQVQYFDKRCFLELAKPSGTSLQLGHLRFTRAGEQLFSVCDAKPVANFFEFLTKRWASLGYSVSDLH